ncbi:MAG TPA: adenylate/guanylate cyclase domain-containing protein [Gaiellaceae bacterium]|nr:adenylate/guanylate cyclase domain-containing protein [Gaiellaceae bacterium]
MTTPETRYARSGDVHIAYQVSGSGPVDLVVIPPWITHLEQAWENEAVAAHYERLGAFSRLIRFDKRGTGLSDRTVGIADMETRMDDARAVMDASGSERAVIFGLSEGAPLAALFAATYPERTIGLILYGSFARVTRAPGYPWGPTREEALAEIRDLVARWGTREWAVDALTDMGLEPTDEEVDFWSRRWRASASPGEVERLELMNLEIDVRDILSTIRVPTLVLHRTSDALPVEGARYVAERIPTARFVEVPGREHGIVMGDPEPIEREIRAFVESLREAAPRADEPERVLATVLFTDIVGSTAHAVELGDRRWRELVSQHHRTIRRELARFRGRELDTAGDGFFAAFDGPARAVRCACAVSDSVRELGLEIRAGLHTGECEVVDGKIGGIAVHIGARVASEAAPGEVLVSQTVRDLVAGSGLEFLERGEAELKGVPGAWRLYAVAR